ncbi:MFS transporter [Actinocatenispora rupis]|uniref:MFS transporter n=1 Tax=Actinocatenispora rupis TaxID=519421 RepID=A0A8J3N8K6_9ACTN|nr:MFS transporter [Actinocatenispora rupis]GID10414.1 MFS transporter [Actinocatenispora rupis]
MTTTVPASQVSRRHGGERRWPVLVAASMAFGVIQLDVSVVNVAVRPITAELGGGVPGGQWVVDAYTVVFAALMLTAGALGDRYGARRMVLAGFAVFAAASLGCALAPGLGPLIAGRAAQGVGGALLGGCALSLLHHAYPEPRERARAVALWAAGASTTLAGGPVLGGLLTDAFGWRSVFLCTVPVGAVGGWLVARYARPSPRSATRLDPYGQVAAVVALTCLAAGTIEAGTRGGTDPLVLALVAAGVPAAVVFGRRATRDAALAPVFRVRPVRAAMLGGLLVNVGFYGLVFVLGLYLQRHLTPSATGLAFVPMMAAIMVGNVTAARLAHRVGPARLVAAGALVMTLGYVGLVVTGDAGYPAMAAQLVALGGGLGLLVPALTGTVLDGVDASRSGVASGAFTTLRQAGSVLGVALFGTLYAGAGGLRTVVVPAGIGTLAVAALVLVRRPRE